MIICDSHVHSEYSFDSSAKIGDICESAIAAGLSYIALTDHFDCQQPGGAFGEGYRTSAARDEILAAKEKYASRLYIAYGIELGQPTQAPEHARELLAENDFEFVIGSLHNLDRVPDFFYMKYDLMAKEEYLDLWKRYLRELSDLIDFEGIHTLAHLTYPIRYYRAAGVTLDLKDYYSEIEALLKKVIAKGLCLEINASGFRQGLDGTIPDRDIVGLYHSLGGRDVTVGSDAHRAADVGAFIGEAYNMLADIGFSYITVFKTGRPEKIKL